MTRKRYLYLVLAFLFFASASFAQRFSHDMRDYFDYGEQSYAAVEQTADASALIVRINTANALFSFQKSDKAHAALGSYIAVRDFSIELREKPFGQVLKTVNVRDSIFTNDFSTTTSKDAWNSIAEQIPLEGIAMPKTVEVHIEVRDVLRSQHAATPVSLDVSLRPYHAERSMMGADSAFIGASDISIFEKPIDAYTYRSKNWGTTTEFSRDMTGGITIALPVNTKAESLVVTLTQVSSMLKEKNFDTVQRAYISVNPDDLIPDRIVKPVDADSDVVYKISEPEKKDSSVRYYAALFKIPGKMLEQGKYRLDMRVKAEGVSRSFSQPLELVWHDMPLSLENPRDAIPPLQHITTDDEYKELSSGSREQQIKKLYTYWKKQDPTPETAYNERMAEFYRRADFAYFNFARNTRMLDGALTDRGKIYILYGAPTNIERTFLLGEQPVEIWTYSNNVKKIVKFTDANGHGDYKLSEVKQM